MPAATFPIEVSDVVATLVEIYRHKNRMQLVELLENAKARFEETNYDNWDGGTYTWALHLEVPVPHYVALESEQQLIEKELNEKCTLLSRAYSNHHVGEVTISPLTSSQLIKHLSAPSSLELTRIWNDNQFRLFISHVSKHKVFASKLKDELSVYGISGFVAHEDIEPSLDWQIEIGRGLQSMNALLAILTPDFHASNWTDQEVGWALGRGILVLPVCMSAVPYGFIGKYQGLKSNLDSPDVLASMVFDVLLANAQTRLEIRRSLINAFVNSGSFAASRKLAKKIVIFSDFSEDEKKLIRSACKENYQISNASGVTATVYRVVGAPTVEKASSSDDFPF